MPKARVPDATGAFAYWEVRHHDGRLIGAFPTEADADAAEPPATPDPHSELADNIETASTAAEIRAALRRYARRRAGREEP